jgi:tRNA pseudouridine38-40 synthase
MIANSINYKVVIEYDGTNYEGVQAQKETENTIYTKVEKALKRLLSGELLELNFCGRTDAGVHAFGQVLNVKTTKKFPENKLALGINYYLRGEGIVALSSNVIEDNFHARYSCKERFYVYKILNRSIKSPIFENRAWFIPYKLDCELMQKGAKLFIGTYDFSYFRSVDCYAKTPIKTINSLSLNVNGEFIEIEISAESFLYKMVRRIVGTLVELGRGGITEADVNLMLANKYSKNVQSAPSHGLYFKKSLY